MFDYLFAEQGMPYLLCPNCNKKMVFHGNFYPLEVVCQNCGQVIDLKNALNKLTYPKRKYDTNGKLLNECE